MHTLDSLSLYHVDVHINSFIFSRYGAGYHLTIEKQRSCDITEISELVKQIVEGAEEMLDIGAELQFLLPSNSSSSFPELLDTLEGRILFFFHGFMGNRVLS